LVGWPLIQYDDVRIIVNRNEFHARLKTEFTSYLAEISDGHDALLRSNFRTKMNFIARV